MVQWKMRVAGIGYNALCCKNLCFIIAGNTLYVLKSK